MRGSHYKKIAVSVVSERKSNNLRGGNLNSEKKELLGSLSFQVVQFWDEGLETAIDDLGEERWMVLEQVRPEFRQLKNFCSFLKWLFTFPTIVDTITPHT